MGTPSPSICAASASQPLGSLRISGWPAQPTASGRADSGGAHHLIDQRQPQVLGRLQMSAIPVDHVGRVRIKLPHYPKNNACSEAGGTMSSRHQRYPPPGPNTPTHPRSQIHSPCAKHKAQRAIRHERCQKMPAENPPLLTPSSRTGELLISGWPNEFATEFNTSCRFARASFASPPQ